MFFCLSYIIIKYCNILDMALPLGLLGNVMDIFKAVAVGIAGLLMAIFTGPIGEFLLKFIIFSFKSSFILVLFLMGGSLFLFVGIGYIYYKLYNHIGSRNKVVKKFYQGDASASDVNNYKEQ